MNQGKPPSVNDTYSRRLHAVIPGGAHTYSRGDDQFPANAPAILERGRGAHVWDPAGNCFLDYGMALRAVTLGYAHPRVNAAVAREIDKGVNLTRATTIELKAAERIVELIPSADMVKFAKNGSNVTTAAAKIARAYTGRTYICVPRQHPFFSFDDWFIGTTVMQRGTVSSHYASTLLFDYGDVASLERLFAEHPGEIAGVMLEPATTQGPCSPACTRALTRDGPSCDCIRNGGNFLHQVQTLCLREGALFILDEMITGFRWHMQGAQTYFGVDPDLTTFGKAMANGFSVAALLGKRAPMEVGSILKEGAERTFLLSTTHGAEMSGLAAFLETIRVYEDEDVVGHLWDYGRGLFDLLEGLSTRHGLADHFVMDGSAIAMNFITRDRDGDPSMALRALFQQEMLRGGVMMPWVAVSLAHDAAALAQTEAAADKALAVYAKALTDGVETYLEGPPLKPVFRKHN